jgi:hypothetical protein
MAKGEFMLLGAFLRFSRAVTARGLVAFCLVAFCLVVFSFALLLAVAPVALSARPQEQEKKPQEQEKKPPPSTQQKKEDGKVPTASEIEKNKKDVVKLSQAEAVAELAIFAYGGRTQLQTSRAAIQEEGTIKLATDQGEITGNYSLRSMRKDKSWLDLLRTDLELSTPEASQRQGAPATVKYVIAFNGATVWSAQNNQYISPRPEAEAAFKAQLTHDYTTLLRYKEDGSKLELKDAETVVGVLTNVLDLTTSDGEKTRYWISAKTFRILHAEYELKLTTGQPPTKYRVSYYYTPYRVVQNTLVPARRVMMQDGKFVQEISLNQITYQAKLDPQIFQHLQGEG